jgi:hypothetical protein
MKQSATPPKFPIPWGNSAGSAYIRSIPVSSQIGTQNGAASLTDGFPPLTFVPSVAGGCPPFGADFNGILKQVTQWSQWQQASGPIFYDSAFAAAIGGYPNGATLSSAIVPGYLWLSTADDNTSNPDTGGANWVQEPGQVPTGTPVPTFAATAAPGYVLANSATIGNASSNAGRASADTQFLFAFLWNLPAATCPIFSSTGAGSTRGASAAADFAANKAIATPLMQGAGLIGIDSGGTAFLTNIPVTSGSQTATASILGENLHALTSAENATHNHTLTDPGHSHTINDPGHGHAINDPGHSHTFSALQNAGPNIVPTGSAAPVQSATIPTSGATTGITINSHTTGITDSAATTGITLAASGSGTGHNTVQRSFTCQWMLKL